MKDDFIDNLSEAYDRFHLEDTEIKTKKNTIKIRPQLKLALGWSLFVLFLVLAIVFVGSPFKRREMTSEEKQDLLTEELLTEEAHDNLVPYEKDAYADLNQFFEAYYKAMVDCDYVALQGMVTDSSQYSDAEKLNKKQEFITGYSDLTLYTKTGYDEGSLIVFVSSKVEIAGVNSTPYDIKKYYVVSGSSGYKIMNSTLSDEATEYIKRVNGDKDIQKIYEDIKKKNEEMTKEDPSLQEFYELINRRDVETKTLGSEAE